MDPEGRWKPLKPTELNRAWTKTESEEFEKHLNLKGFGEGSTNLQNYTRQFNEQGDLRAGARPDHYHGGGYAGRIPADQSAYMVRAGSPPAAGDDPSPWAFRLFTGPDALKRAQSYADTLQARARSKGMEAMRREAGIPDQWQGGKTSTWRELQIIRIEPRPAAGGEPGGVAYWQGTIAPQHDWSPARAGVTVPGGEGQVLIYPNARKLLTIVDTRDLP